MKTLKKIFDFYINSSIHVALSVLALIQITGLVFQIDDITNVSCFAFFGTIFGYNFVKYEALYRSQKIRLRLELQLILFLSLIAFLASGYFFYTLKVKTQFIGLGILLLTLLYTLPFFPNNKNARNWSGLKIYIVTICWVVVTVLLPIIDSELPLSFEIALIFIQRFILVFVLILIFEIVDLKTDDPLLKTVPQQIGVTKTERLGCLLLIIFVCIEFLYPNFKIELFHIKLGIAITSYLFLRFSNENRSRYYASFWVESIPIVWYLSTYFKTLF